MKKCWAIISGTMLACCLSVADDSASPSNVMLRAEVALRHFLSDPAVTNAMSHVREATLENQDTRLVILTPGETIFVTTGEKCQRNGYHMEPHPDMRYLTWNTQAPGVQVSVYQQHPTFVHLDKSPVVFPGKAKPPEEKDPVVLALLRALKRNEIELKEADEEAPNNTPDIRR
jgi:hypothetical protein